MEIRLTFKIIPGFTPFQAGDFVLSLSTCTLYYSLLSNYT